MSEVPETEPETATATDQDTTGMDTLDEPTVSEEEVSKTVEEKHEEPPKPPEGGDASETEKTPGKKAKKGKGEKGKKEKKQKKAKELEEPKEEESEMTSSTVPGNLLDEFESELKKMIKRDKLPLSGSSTTQAQSVSVLSEDSTSSKEDLGKKTSEEVLDDGYKYEEKLEFCISAIEGNRDISTDLRLSITTLLHKYQQALDKYKKNKEKTDAEMSSTTEKMKKDLHRAKELEEEVNKLKKKVAVSEQTIENLKRELDESYTREHDLIDERKLFEQKIELLTSDLEKKKLEDQLREQGLDITAKSRETFTKDIIRLKQELDLSESRLQLCLRDLEELHQKYKEKEMECNEMEEMLKANKYEVLKEAQKTKIVEADLERVSDDMRKLKVTVARHYKTFKNASQELMKKDEEVFELRKTSRTLTQQNESLVKLVSELKERLEISTNNYLKIEGEYKELKEFCSSQKGNLDNIMRKSIDTEKSQDRWLGRIENAERRRRKAIQEAKRFFNQLKEMSYESKKTRLTVIRLNRTITVFKRENTILSKQTRHLQGIAEQQKKQAEEKNHLVYQISEEAKKLRNEIAAQKKALANFFREKEMDMKDKMIMEQATIKIKADLGECSLENSRLKKEFDEKSARLTQMEEMYNAAITEKKYLYKRLLEAQGQIKHLQNKAKFIFNEMELIKDQLHKKQQDYEKLQTSNRKDVFTKDTMTIKLDNCMENRKSLLKTIEEKDLAINQQIDIVIKKESKIKELQLESETFKRQIGDLKTVIQKRNAELSLVYEKTELMKYILSHGEEQYQQRLKDIELLKKEIRKLRADKKVLISLSENTPNLRMEMFHLHKDLSKERQKCRALEEQMENPLNIHRWRLLEGTDPEKKDLIEKNQILQKKLIRVEHDNGVMREQCASMEMLYLNMRTYLNKLPSRNAAQYLELAKRNLRSKTQENRQLSAELAAYENELSVLKKQMEEIKWESNQMKEKYYELKRKCDHEKINRNSEGIINRNSEDQEESPKRNLRFKAGRKKTT